MEIGVLLDAHPYEMRNLNDEAWSQVALYEGTRLAARAPKVQVLIEDTEPLSEFLTVAGKPLVSDRVRSLLERERVNAEFLEADVRCSRQATPTDPYYFMNLLDIIDCVDEDKSHIKRHPTFYYVQEIGQLVLTPAAEKSGSLMFRPSSLKTRIFATRPIERVLSSEGVTGFLFCSVTQYRFPSTELLEELRERRRFH